MLRCVACPSGCWLLLLVGSPLRTSLRPWWDVGPGGSLRPDNLPCRTSLTGSPQCRLYLPEKFRFWGGSRDRSINSCSTNKITKTYTFPSSGRGKRSLHYCIHKHDGQVQTTQLDLQLHIHHSCSAKMQTCKYCIKRTAPGTSASLEALMNAVIPI